jgi:hypothetical protein
MCSDGRYVYIGMWTSPNLIIILDSVTLRTTTIAAGNSPTASGKCHGIATDGQYLYWAKADITQTCYFYRRLLNFASVWSEPENGGTYTASGNGSQTVFNIAHGLGDVPTDYRAEPLTADSRASRLLSADATNIIVTFDVAPPVGTNNVSFSWFAKLR